MSRYNVSPEAGNRLSLDLAAHVEAMQGRHFINGRLNDDYATLTSLRDARFRTEGTDDRAWMRERIKKHSNGLYRFEDVIAISRTEHVRYSFPEEFLLHDLGRHSIEGRGQLYSVVLKRVTSIDPRQQEGVDLLQVISLAENERDGTAISDSVKYTFQDLRGPGSVPKLSAEVGCEVWQGRTMVERYDRDINDPSVMQDVHNMLDVVSMLTISLAGDLTVVSDISMPE